MACVLHHSKASGTDKVVLLGIANHDGDGGSWPSVATLTKYARVARKNVQASLRRLETSGEIRTHLGDGGTPKTPDHYRPNRYEVLVRCPAECDGTTQHRMPGDSGYTPRRPVDNQPVTPGGYVGVAGGGYAYVAGGATPTSPKPSLEPSLEPSLPPTPRDDAASPAAEDQQGGGRDDHDEPEDQPTPDGVTRPRHEKDEHARRAIARHLNSNQLPADLLDTTLAACYRIGHGDPWRAWTGSGIRAQLTEDLDRVRNVSAVIRSRLRDMPVLAPVKAVTVPCPHHPDQPAGRCNTCTHTTTRMPPGWRAATRKTAQTEGATAA